MFTKQPTRSPKLINIFILMSHEIKYDDTKLANCLQTQIDNNNTTPTEYKIRFRRLILILMCAPKEIITVFPDPLAQTGRYENFISKLPTYKKNSSELKRFIRIIEFVKFIFQVSTLTELESETVKILDF